ncbi:MAG: glycosyltransferase, partial [Gammaproteobacteria bacterium]|nr:glycosyltransferase [Gammaproteobacteria bacterium]
MDEKKGLYIVLISVHGLLRGQEPELGRDADTGGQILYVLDLAQQLIRHPDVRQVDVLTRRIHDKRIAPEYAAAIEPLAEGVNIIRLECGPRRYLRKEVLWPYMDEFVDKAIHHVRKQGRVPDIIHSHYADAGYVGSRLASLLGIVHIHTGHSLGRVKLKQLLARGLSAETIEKRYNISQRIEAEELALDTAALVIASTSQEVEEQYALYDNYHPGRMKVMPPGVDLSRFMPLHHYETTPSYKKEISRFLEHPKKPMILAMSRADERKNVRSLLQAYGERPALQERANLILVIGNSDNISEMERGPRSILREVIMMIDHYDLYGKVAYPKHHDSDDVPNIYRLAAKSRGVFVNPALTEPFGLTIIEASACGLPVVVTHDGGPRDIIRLCKNGSLIDPLDITGMTHALINTLSNKGQWRRWSKNGIKGTEKYYSWPGHIDNYIKEVHRLLHKEERHKVLSMKNKLPMVKRLAISAIDNCLTGDETALKKLIKNLYLAKDQKLGFGVATGRGLESSLRILRKWKIPLPDVLITSVGSEIYYAHQGRHMVADHSWEKHINYRWQADKIITLLSAVPGLRLRGRQEQAQYRVSCFINPNKQSTIADVKQLLRTHDLHANVILSIQINPVSYK